MVADEQDHRAFGSVELVGSPGQQLLGHPPVIKEIASDEDGVRIDLECEVDGTLKSSFLKPRPRTADPEMDIREVQDRSRSHTYSITQHFVGS